MYCLIKLLLRQKIQYDNNLVILPLQCLQKLGTEKSVFLKDIIICRKNI